MPSCDDDILPIWIVLDKYDCLWIVGKRTDIFWELHPVVAGVDGTADSTRCSVDRQEVPPL